MSEGMLSYDDGGVLKDVRAVAGSEGLVALLRKINWAAIPSPSLYSLHYWSMEMSIVMSQNVLHIYVKVF
jgi:hypothetical protein